MATAKNATRSVQLEDAQDTDFELADADYSEAMSEAVCPSCGELLAWHEQACSAQPAPELVDEPPASGFAYELGHLVLPATQQQAHPVLWRGQLKERHPATGLVHRINVYQLGDGHWDCYREEELRAA